MDLLAEYNIKLLASKNEYWAIHFSMSCLEAERKTSQTGCTSLERGVRLYRSYEPVTDK